MAKDPKRKPKRRGRKPSKFHTGIGEDADFTTQTRIDDWWEAGGQGEVIPVQRLEWSSETHTRVLAIEAEYKRLMREYNMGDIVDNDRWNLNFHLLPPDDRDRLIRAYDEAIGLRDIMEEYGPGKLMGERERPFFRLNTVLDEVIGTGEPVNVGVVLSARQTIQARAERAMRLGDKFFAAHTSGSRLSVEAGESVARLLAEPPDLTGKKILTMDIETAGLRDTDGMHELSARISRAAASGSVEELRSETWLFENNRMDAGAAHIGGRPVPLGEFFRHRVGGGRVVDKAQGLMEFFQMAEDADFIIGQNIQNFDFPKIRADAMAVGAWNNPQFRAAFERVEKMFDPTEGKVIDSIELLRTAFGDKIGMNPELARRGAMTGHFSPFGIQNVLLQTNILDIMADDMGEGAVTALLRQGEHIGAVDVVLEDYAIREILKHMRGEGGLEFRPPSNAVWSEKLLNSGAITPTSKIADADHVVDALRPMLKAQGLLGPDGAGITYMDQAILLGQDISLMTPSAKALQLNPVEMAVRSRMWKDFSSYEDAGGFITAAGTLAPRGKIPTADEWAKFQAKMHKAGMPFAGLSWQERHLSSLMGGIGYFGGGASPGIKVENRMRRIFGPALGVGAFQEPPAGVGAAGRRGIVPTLTQDILRKAEEAGDIFTVPTYFRDPSAGLQVLDIDPFEIKSKKDFGVGLFAQLFQDAEDPNIGKFRAFLLNEGIEAANVDQAIEALKARGGKAQVGVMFGGGAKKFYKSLVDLMGTDVSSGAQKFATTMIRNTIPGKRAEILVSQVFNRAALENPEFREAVGETNRVVEEAHTQAYELARDETNRKLHFVEALFDKRTGRHMETYAKVTNVYLDKIRPNALKMGLGTMAAIGTYYLTKGHVRQNKFDETVEEMDYESTGDQAKYRQEMRYDILPPATPGKQRVDPMATASVVSNLDLNKVGHTRMGNRNAHLYNA